MEKCQFSMYVILTVFIFGFSMVQSERLECYDCSEIATDSAAVCSKNETRSKKAVDDEGNIFECTAWKNEKFSLTEKKKIVK